MFRTMECNFCHYYDAMEGICNKTGCPMRGDNQGCDSFIYYQSNFNLEKEPDDFFSFFLGEEAEYLVEGRKDDNRWVCFMSDTECGSFMTMCIRVYSNLTKEECIKEFIAQIHRQLEDLQTVLAEDLSEIYKKEYLALMEK